MKKIIFIAIIYAAAFLFLMYQTSTSDASTEDNTPIIVEPEQTDGTGQAITMDIIKSTYRVINRSFNDELGYTSTGTAFAFHKTETHIYLLTNAHVVKKQPGYLFQSFKLIDYYNNIYEAELFDYSINLDKDLAILVIEINENPIITLTPVDITIGERVKALGYYPTVQLTYGLVTNKPLVNFVVKNMVVISHDASIIGGASGGPLLNSENKVIGINFASVTSNQQFLQAYAIPINEILDYLDQQFWEAL